MKKSLPFLFLILFIATQTFSQQRQRFGINAGVTYSEFSGMDMFTIKYKPGFGYMAGVSYEYYFNDDLSLKTNLSYDNKSSKATSDIELIDGESGLSEIAHQTIMYHYNYMTLPILIKYDFVDGAGFFVNGGPFVGYLLNSGYTSKVSSSYDFPNDSVSTTDYNNKLDFGLTLGFGKAFELNDGSSIVVEIRDNLGFAQINKKGTYDGNSVKSNSFNLVLGWAFDL